ncbi:MAG: hypothetical protein ABIA47_03160 [bacterium]
MAKEKKDTRTEALTSALRELGFQVDYLQVASWRVSARPISELIKSGADENRVRDMLERLGIYFNELLEEVDTPDYRHDAFMMSEDPDGEIDRVRRRIRDCDLDEEEIDELLDEEGMS